MSNHVFEIKLKSGRKIHLSKERWSHIRKEHPDITHTEEIIKTLFCPDKINLSDKDESVRWYYLYNKLRRRFMKVSVKYLNGNAYFITCHYTTKIQ